MALQLGPVIGKIGGGNLPLLDSSPSVQVGEYKDVDVAELTIPESAVYAVFVKFSSINGAANADSFFLDLLRNGNRLARFVHSNRSSLMSVSGAVELPRGALTLQVLNSSSSQSAVVGRVLVSKIG